MFQKKLFFLNGPAFYHPPPSLNGPAIKRRTFFAASLTESFHILFMASLTVVGGEGGSRSLRSWSNGLLNGKIKDFNFEKIAQLCRAKCYSEEIGKKKYIFIRNGKP